MKHSAKAITLTGFAGAAAVAGATQAYGQIVNLVDPTNIAGHAANTASSATHEFYTVLTGKTSKTSSTGAQIEFGYLNNSTYSEFFTGFYGLTTGTKLAANGVYNSYSSSTDYYASAIAKGGKIGTGGGYTFGQTTGEFSFISLENTSTDDTYQSNQLPNQTYYLGFQFLDTSDNAIHDGWLEVESETYVSTANPGGLIFLGGAYNATSDANGGTILAGQTAVPEPGTLSALAAGAAALAGVGLKRRRKAAAAA